MQFGFGPNGPPTRAVRPMSQASAGRSMVPMGGLRSRLARAAPGMEPLARRFTTMLSHTVGGRSGDAWYAGIAARVPARALVFSGILMFALYIAMDVVATLSYDGYSYKDQVISEFSAIDAPTRNGWLVASVFYCILLFAFAFGVLCVEA